MKISEILAETGAQIGQIHRHMHEGPFIIMSAWRANFSLSQNRDRNAQLRQQILQNYGMGSIDQKGFWPIEKDNNGNITATGHEDSVFIPMVQPTSRVSNINEFLDLARRLMVEYDQDAVLVNNGHATYLISNPNRAEYDPQPVRLGNDIRVFGINQKLPDDVEGWSQKRNYKYTVADKGHEAAR